MRDGRRLLARHALDGAGLSTLELEHHGEVIELLLVFITGIKVVLEVEIVFRLLDIDALELAEHGEQEIALFLGGHQFVVVDAFQQRQQPVDQTV